MLAALFDLACPRRCAGCGVRGVLLCAECRDQICGTPFAADPIPCPAGLPQVVATSTYDGATRSAIIAFKERSRTGLAAPLGDALAAGLEAVGAELVVPVPSSPAAHRSRGYDHVGLLARRACMSSGAVVLDGLTQHRRVADQSGLGSLARTLNIDGSMRFAGPSVAPGARVVVVDDIVTSGATLAEATRALRAGGIEAVAVAVVAATARRSLAATRFYKRAVQG